MPVEEVVAMLDERFPELEWDPKGDDDWETHVARRRALRAERHALAEAHGYSVMDIYYARWGRRLP